MDALELVLLLQIAIAILVFAARRIHIPYPILLVLGGLGLGLIPGLPQIELEPDLVLLVFLPPLLFFAGYLTPFRDFRANTRPIGLLAVGLVLAITVAVALVMGAAVPELAGPAAFALGAIVSPPDAVAATAIFRSLGAPRRIVTILEGESLLNDATALVVYRAALAAAASGTAFVLLPEIPRFFIVAGGGIVIGLVVGAVFTWIFANMEDPPVEVAISLAVPYAAFLPAEQFGLSGVLAAVVAGLYLGRQSARVLSSNTRLLGGGAWQIVIFTLEGFTFILIGLQMPRILGELAGRKIEELLFLSALISITVIVVRILWVYPATYLPRMLVPKIREADPAPPLKVPFVIAWSGMRGAVSLAAALALPRDFPERDLILFLTFVVILVTLVGQGLTLPLVLRLAGVAGEDGGNDREEVVARRAANEAAVAEIARLRQRWPDHVPLIEQLEFTYSHRSEHLPGGHEHAEEEHDQELIEHRAIRQAVIDAEREAVIALRDQGIINDDVLRRLEREIDLEELRMEA